MTNVRTHAGRLAGPTTLIVILVTLAALADLSAQRQRREIATEDSALSLILGRPTDRAVTASVLSPAPIEARLVWGMSADALTTEGSTVNVAARTPTEVVMHGLRANTRYHYQLHTRQPGEDRFATAVSASFMTARATGSTFSFGVQGDSHPERDQRMFDATLYRRTLDLVGQARPDLYFMMGDDFSIERLIASRTATQATVDAVYAGQRPFLTRVATSASLFLVNGNHEEAARFLVDGTATNPAVLAGRARTRFYPLPAPDDFYSGNARVEPHVGLLRDYYAWTWGDALFVVIDPYWHSPVQVDADPGGGGGGVGRRADQPRQAGTNAARASGRARDLWQVTLGDDQYQWLRRTLQTSSARFKFVFAHHVMGTGRGGVEVAGDYEWGGRDPRGRRTFQDARPAWPQPIHQLMASTGVSVFFQGHDHLFAKQEKDGVIYQSVPNPADLTYTAFNRDAYRSGQVFPNSGYLHVTVAPNRVRVDYIRSFLPAHTSSAQQHGSVAFSYDVLPRQR